MKLGDLPADVWKFLSSDEQFMRLWSAKEQTNTDDEHEQFVDDFCRWLIKKTCERIFQSAPTCSLAAFQRDMLDRSCDWVRYWVGELHEEAAAVSAVAPPAKNQRRLPPRHQVAHPASIVGHPSASMAQVPKPLISSEEGERKP